MKISCQYCGKIHEKSFDCGKKPKRVFKSKFDNDSESEAKNVRKRNRWTKKSLFIRERDNFQCQLCARGIYHTLNRINTDDVEVHHIVPIKEDPSRAYDDSNLITLCKYHHEVSEQGIINRSELFKVVEEQMSKY